MGTQRGRKFVLVLGALGALAMTDTARADPSLTIVVVFPIEDASGVLDQPTRDSLTDFLAARIGAAPGYTIVPRAEIQARMAERKSDSYKSCYDQSCQIEIGKELAATHVVATNMSRVGSQCIVTAYLFSLLRGVTAATASETRECNADALLAGIGAIAGQLTRDTAIAKAKAEPAKAEPPKPEPAKVAPPSPEPAKVEPPRAEPAKTEPAKPALAVADPPRVADPPSPRPEPAQNLTTSPSPYADSDDDEPSLVLPLILMGAGVAALTTGGVFFAKAKGHEENANDPEFVGAQLEPDQAETAQNVSFLSAGVGIAAAGVGLVLLLLQ